MTSEYSSGPEGAISSRAGRCLPLRSVLLSFPISALVVSLCTPVSAKSQANTQGLDTIQVGRFDMGKMWTFEYGPMEYFTETYASQADQAWFDRARMAALRIPGCSAALVSPNGLVVTNHHCVRGPVVAVTEEGESLLDDGFYATLLDLHRRKKIQITTKRDGLIIKIVDDRVDDRYERRVMGFLQMLADDGEVDTNKIAEFTETIKKGELEGKTSILMLRNTLVDLTTDVDEKVASGFVVKGQRKIIPFLILSILTNQELIALYIRGETHRQQCG